MSRLFSCEHPRTRQRPLFPARDYITGDPFTIYRCGVCGLASTLPRPAGADLQRYYPPSYYGQGRRYGAPLERLLAALYAVRARGIVRASGAARGSALDVGCGRGQILDQLRRRGWKVVGTELSDASAAYARDMLGLTVHVGPLADLALPAEGFSLVILWHVLEHAEDPAGLLREIVRLLKPGGTLLVAVPNFGSPEARIGRGVWFHLDVPRHLSHFTPRTLAALLEDAGLRPISAAYHAVEYDSFSFVQTLLNRLPLRHNVLFNVLRARGARTLQGAEPIRGREVAISLLLAAPLGLLSLLWTPLVAVLGRGATVRMYARKPGAHG